MPKRSPEQNLGMRLFGINRQIIGLVLVTDGHSSEARLEVLNQDTEIDPESLGKSLFQHLHKFLNLFFQLVNFLLLPLILMLHFS